MKRRRLLLMVLVALLGVGCLYLADRIAKDLPSDQSFAVTGNVRTFRIKRAGTEGWNGGVYELVMPDAFAPEIKSDILALMGTWECGTRSTFGIPYMVEVRCGVDINQFADDGPPVPVTAENHERIVDGILRLRPEFARMGRDVWLRSRGVVEFPLTEGAVAIAARGAGIVTLGGVTLLALAGWLIGEFRARRRGGRRVEGRCEECGYSLRGLGRVGRCPECGAERVTGR